MQTLKSFLKKVKKLLFTRQNLALVALIVSFLYFSKASHHGLPQIRLNYFLSALNKNYITDLYLSGPTINFKGIGSDWYQTDRSMLSQKTLDCLMMNYPQVNISRQESIFSSFNRSSFFIYSLACVVIVQTLRFNRD